MATLDVKTPNGTSAGSVEVSDKVFGIEPNHAVLHQVVTAQLAARRAGTQSTKTRGEVRGAQPRGIPARFQALRGESLVGPARFELATP